MFGLNDEDTRDRSGDILRALGRMTEFLRRPDWRNDMQELLGTMGRATDADRVYVYEVAENAQGKDFRIFQTFEWCAEGVDPQFSNPLLQNVSSQDLTMDPYMEELRRGELVMLDVLSLPSELRTILFDIQGIYSMLWSPIFVDGDFWGLLGFDDCRSPKRWSAEEIAALKTSGNMLGVLMERDGIQARAANWQEIVEENQILRGLIPLCPACQKLWDSEEFRELWAVFIREYPKAATYGRICPDCRASL